MRRYALLIAPSSNRVYAGEAARITVAEVAAFGAAALEARLGDPHPITLGGVPYVEFSAEPELTAQDIAQLSRVSAAYALFELVDPVGGGEPTLRPLRLSPPARYDDDLVTILKYPGKTNEQFTQLLLNLTVLATDRGGRATDRKLVVLDPLCGRGTTLNVALRYGYDVIGIESDRGQVEAYGAFLRTWLRRKRLKHHVEVAPVRHHGKRVARKLTATLAASRDSHQAGQVERVTVYEADTLRARELLRPGCCDVIVTDTPYGVAHGSRLPERAGLARRPRDLLAAAVPGWAQLLRRGGALGMSFNSQVADREELAGLLTAAGLTVIADGAYGEFTHWVDQSITREVLVARKADAR